MLHGGWKCYREAESVAGATERVAGRLKEWQGGWKCCMAAGSVTGRLKVLQGRLKEWQGV